MALLEEPYLLIYPISLEPSMLYTDKYHGRATTTLRRNYVKRGNLFHNCLWPRFFNNVRHSTKSIVENSIVAKLEKHLERINNKHRTSTRSIVGFKIL